MVTKKSHLLITTLFSILCLNGCRGGFRSETTNATQKPILQPHAKDPVSYEEHKIHKETVTQKIRQETPTDAELDQASEEFEQAWAEVETGEKRN